jgi:DNA-binding GntR family transcriptional regulator
MQPSQAKKSFKSIAYLKIREMILQRELLWGDKLFENELAQNLGMSRTPVREALLTLEGENLIEKRDRLGFMVRRPKPDEIKDYFNVRILLEKFAAPLIIANISKDEFKVLQKNVSQAQVYLNKKDTKNFIICNSLFHEVLATASKSDIYCRLMSSLNDISVLLRAMSLRNTESMQSSLDCHKEILRVIQSGDAELLSSTFFDHIQGIQEEIDRYMLL